MKIYWLVLVFLIVILPSLLFIVYKPASNNNADFEITVPYLETLIDTSGPQIAYDKFASAIADLAPHDQHTAAHTFGTALYNATSIDGLSVCDERFSNGCFHSFSGSAIAEGGFESTVPLMVKKCNEEETVPLTHSCLHGVGHGIQAYLGYEYANLSKGIETCREKTTGNLTAGCWGGVFMEYNLRTLIGIDSVRPLTEATRYTPCDSISEDLRPSCMYWQPEWWEEVSLHNMSVTDFFLKAGNYCADLPVGDERRACFSGIGSIMPTRIFDIIEESAMCRQIAQNVEDALACWSFIYNKTPYSEKTEVARENFCNEFVEEELNYCLEHKDSPADIFNERGEAIFP